MNTVHIIYLNCRNMNNLDGKKIITVIDTTFAVKRKPEKTQACTGLEPYDIFTFQMTSSQLAC